MSEEIKFSEKEINGKIYLNIGKPLDFYEGKGKRFQLGPESDDQIAVFRFKGKLFALTNICPHRHMDQIHNGFIVNSCVVCPVHGWTYSIETGYNINSKQGIKKLDKYNIFEEDDNVWVEKPEFKKANWKYFDESSSDK